MDAALAVDSREMQTGIHASSTHPKQAASRFPRLPTRSTSPIRLPNLATKTLSANLNAFPRQSGVGITGLRKEDRKQKQSEHECRNGFGEGDKIAARLGIGGFATPNFPQYAIEHGLPWRPSSTS